MKAERRRGILAAFQSGWKPLLRYRAIGIPSGVPCLDSGLFRVIRYSPLTEAPGREKTGMTIVGVVWCERCSTLLGACLFVSFVSV